jgi:hypothetical protein
MDDLAWVEYRLRRTADAPSFDALVVHYESRAGRVVDRDAIAYYAVLVQVRCAITTARTIARGGGAVGLAGYLVAHQRFLQGITERLARAMGIAIEPIAPVAASLTSDSEMYDRAIDDLEHGVLPELDDPAVKLRARSAVIYLRHLRAVDRIGAPVEETEAPIDVAGAGERGDFDVLAALARRAAWNVELWPDA